MNSFFGRLLAPFRNTTGLARWILVTGLIITGTFVIAAIFAPILAPYGFAQMSVAGVDFPKTSPPGPGHLFGTNNQFYDILSRVIWGAQTAISVVLLSVVLFGLLLPPIGMVVSIMVLIMASLASIFFFLVDLGIKSGLAALLGFVGG